MRKEPRFTIEYASPGRRMAPYQTEGNPWVRDVPFVCCSFGVVIALLYVVAFVAHWIVAALIY